MAQKYYTNVSPLKRFMVASTEQALEIFDAVLESRHLDRSTVVMNLVRQWVLERTEQSCITILTKRYHLNDSVRRIYE